MAWKVTNYEGFHKSQNGLYKHGKINLINIERKKMKHLWPQFPYVLEDIIATFQIYYPITRKCDEILLQVCKLMLLLFWKLKLKIT
jgi:hypothetical protein